MKAKKVFKSIILALIITALVAAVIALAYYALQKYYAHRNAPFTPDYERVELTENTDYETIFLQTGIGQATAEKLISQNRFGDILKAQENFFKKPQVECREMIGFFTMEDVLSGEKNTPFYDLRAGDILVTLSTHSGGWRHGHAAMVISPNVLLECRQIGTTSSYEDTDYWEDYSNYAVLRVKGITDEMRKEVKAYSVDKLHRVPYNLFSGIFGKKAPDRESKNFGLYCTNLMWYAWEKQGIDLDSDGGRIVTAYDLLHSDKVEIVQLFGMDPREFVD